jgi:16S rRNA processing protein RimM
VRDTSGQPLPPGTVPESPPADLVEVGRVVDAYGIRGWVKIAPFNDPNESVLRTSRRWWLPDGRPLAVERARVHSATIVARPAGVETREAALALKGLTLRVSRADFPRDRPDEFFWIDLVGCRVVNPQGETLGQVEAVEDHGAHPILVLRDELGVERMIPFVDAHIVSVDLKARAIVAEWQLDY